MTGEPMHTTSKEMASRSPATNYRLKVKYLLCFVVSYVQFHSITNQELFEEYLCNQSSQYEKSKQFPLQREGKPLHATAKSTPFTVSKDEWRTLVSP